MDSKKSLCLPAPISLKFCDFIILAFLSILSSALLAQVGGTIAFQGVLRDPQGTTVVDGSYNLTFKIYDDPAASASSNVIYEEDISSVYVSGGVFSVEHIKYKSY